MMRIRFRDFMIAGSLGRALRFAAIATLFGAASLDAQPAPAGDTYVLVSGMVGGRAGFQRLEAELKRRGARVLVVDPYALSIDSADVTFAAMARRVDRVLEREGITNARLVGHAHGGGVMLRVAASYPHRASSLYFLDVGALPENRTRVLSRSVRLAPVVVKLPYGRDVVRRKLVEGLRENSAGDAWLDVATQRSYTDPVLDHMRRVIGLAERLATASEPEPVKDVVARLRVPAVVILGDAPRTSKPSDDEVATLASTGRTRVERMRGVGHFPHEEAPAAVASLLVAGPAKQVAQVLP
jgi:pimeloyl-ACP methyl ester carboxylesterase